MKLFDGFEAVKFPEENLILITSNGYLQYYYHSRYQHWYRHKNAGNDLLSVSNYPNVSKEELSEVMGGKFPEKETDFLRLCYPTELHVGHMLKLLEEDYTDYMAERMIWLSVREFLSESDICHKSFEKLNQLFSNALDLHQNLEQVLNRIKELSFTIIGRDIFKKEIGIIDGHDPSSYFWIRPVRVIDYKNTDDWDNVAEMPSLEISIEEDDVAQYLKPFLDKYFDDNLKANRRRIKDDGEDDEDSDIGFEWYLTHNFYTFESVINMLKDISDTADALASGKENEFTAELKIKRGTATHQLIYARGLSDEQIKEYNDNRPTVDDTEADLVIDFFHRFIYRMEYMVRVGREKGYDLISVMGP